MKSSIYDYQDYKTYLNDVIENSGHGGRGKRKDLAAAIRCQVSHVSMVLSGDGHFNQEQAEAAARFFGFNAAEAEFLLLLVLYNRAGTKSLKAIYRGMLDERRAKYGTLGARIKMKETLKIEQELIYYSSWHFGAMHVLLSIPEFQTRDAMSQRLKIPLSRVDEVLNYLVDWGLCIKIGVTYQPARPLLHLPKDSPIISKHHTNWRLKAMQSYEAVGEENFHYSGVFSVARKDLAKIKKVIDEALIAAMAVVTASPEEDVAALCIDFFPL